MFLVLVVFFSIPLVHSQNETSSLIDSLCEDTCTFEPRILTSENYKQWPKKCSTVCADLYIGIETSMGETKLNATFKNLKRLVGSLIVKRTKLKSIKFLAGLESLECDNGFFTCELNPEMTEIGMLNLTSISCRLNIAANAKMTRLNLPNLKNFEPINANNTPVDVDIHSLAPDFCVTIQEMTNFLSDEDVEVDQLFGSYCDITTKVNETEKVCGFENSTLADMESGCVHVRGDVFVESGDEEHVEKLETVKSIFGILVINGTNLTDVDFLGGLEYVASLKLNESAIQVKFNPDLSNVTFPSLKRVHSDTRYSIIFNNNSQQLLMDPDICFRIRNALNLTDDFAPTIDGQSCEKIKEDAISRISRELLPLLSVFFILVCYTFTPFS